MGCPLRLGVEDPNATIFVISTPVYIPKPRRLVAVAVVALLPCLHSSVFPLLLCRRRFLQPTTSCNTNISVGGSSNVNGGSSIKDGNGGHRPVLPASDGDGDGDGGAIAGLPAENLVQKASSLPPPPSSPLLFPGTPLREKEGGGRKRGCLLVFEGFMATFLCSGEVCLLHFLTETRVPFVLLSRQTQIPTCSRTCDIENEKSSLFLSTQKIPPLSLNMEILTRVLGSGHQAIIVLWTKADDGDADCTQEYAGGGGVKG